MNNLKNLRHNLNLSQRECAEALNIAKTTFCYYEQDKISPSTEMLKKMADFFGCSVDYLIGHETPGIMHLDSFTPTQKEIISLFPSLSEENSRLARSYIYGLIEGEENRQSVLRKFKQ